MVRYKDYVITADKNCYIIGKMKERKNKETGEMEPFVFAEKYCTSISQAASILAEMARMDFVRNNDIQLNELLEHIKRVDEEIISALGLKK